MRLLTLLFCLSLSVMATAQSRVFIHDGRQKEACNACDRLFYEKPREILFGIDLHTNGDVYFTTSNKQWLYKLITGPQDGVTTDLVTKDQFGCQVTLPDDNSVNKGFVLPPVYTAELKKFIYRYAAEC